MCCCCIYRFRDVDVSLAAQAWLRVIKQQGATGHVLFFLFFTEWLRLAATIVDDAKAKSQRNPTLLLFIAICKVNWVFCVDNADAANNATSSSSSSSAVVTRESEFAMIPGFCALAVAFAYHLGGICRATLILCGDFCFTIFHCSIM